MFVYFIRSGHDGPVKIGYAVNVARRIAALQAGNHEPLKVLRVMPGGRGLEGRLHREFRASRIAREWYRLDPRMMTIDPSDLLTDETPATPSGASGLTAVSAHAAIIDQLGGIKAVAGSLSLPPAVVRKWHARKRIPAWRWPDLMAAFPAVTAAALSSATPMRKARSGQPAATSPSPPSSEAAA